MNKSKLTFIACLILIAALITSLVVANTLWILGYL